MRSIGTHCPLDHNHTHFILVDNSQLNVFGGEISFRGKLESAISSYISKYKNFKLGEDGSAKIPIVVLVLEGDSFSLKDRYALKLKSFSNKSRGSQYIRDSFHFSQKWFTLRIYRG